MYKIVTYPAIFTPEKNNIFVSIPDFPNGFTQGKDFADAVNMACDLIKNILTSYDLNDFPKASKLDADELGRNQQLVYITIGIN